MKKLALVLLLVTAPALALAGSFSGPLTARVKPTVNAVECATMALTRTDQDHRCYEVASANKTDPNAYAAECRFVMALSAVKTQWRVDGKYDANGVYSGYITQTLPVCSGFLCDLVGSVQWTGRNSAPFKQYFYTWFHAGQNTTAGCDVTNTESFPKGLFYGSY